MMRNISYRYKLPMYMISVSSLTAVIAIMVVSWQYYSQGKLDLTVQSHELGNSMTNMLALSLNHKDVWHAYSLLRGREDKALTTPKHTFIVFDENQTVFASNQPQLFPTGAHISELTSSSNSFLETLNKAVNTKQPREFPHNRHLLSSLPLTSDEIVIGNLVIIDTYDSLTALFNKISLQGMLVILTTLAIIAPMAWFWGKRIANPLLNLESCILKVGNEPLTNIQCEIRDNHDEIGRLSRHFQNMINKLKQKQDLEKKVIESDRLAAVGTLAASVAHEINNPLAGMIMAVDTYKQYCVEPDCKQRADARASIELVERGLMQIQETVTALLSNVNIYDKPLTRIDIEDIFKLVSPNSNKKYIKFECNNEIRDTIKISSTYVRQILINLLLNAIHATNIHGHIVCHSHADADTIRITIKNDGDPIPEQQMKHLFDPNYLTNFTGSGLGLWITQQITERLKGSIKARRDRQWTIFEVELPIHNKDA